MKRPRKRILLMLTLMLVSGAIINIAIAWTCVQTTSRSKLQYGDGGKETYPIVDGYHVWPSHWPKSTQYLQFVVSSRGILYVQLEAGPHYQSQMATMWQAGFPLLSMEGRSSDGKDGRNIQCAIATMQRAHDGGFPGLPLLPVWPGFAINTVFYAGILWVLFTTPGIVRRRIRIKRGRCSACGYPVGVSDVCTECGGLVTSLIRGARG